MESKIWMHLIHMLTYRTDIIDTIIPFFKILVNNSENKRYSLQDEKYIPFLRTLSKIQLYLLYNYDIIGEEKYLALVPKEETTLSFEEEKSKSHEEIVTEIIQGDKLEDLQQLIREKGIKEISPITKSFNEVEKMTIPIIIYCIIKKAFRCFKYLLINGIEDPTKTMEGQKHDNANGREEEHQYNWDCACIAIYYGQVEIVKILEENGIEKGKNPIHIEAAILSYRNSIAKEIINKEKKNKDQILIRGLLVSAKNNNIKGGELIIKKREKLHKKTIPLTRGGQTPLHIAAATNSKEMIEILISKRISYINATDIIYQNKIILI